MPNSLPRVFLLACVFYVLANLAARPFKIVETTPDMPINPTVMIIGSSVVAVPLFKLDHEKPGVPFRAYLKEHPVMTVPSFETTLAKYGLRDATVYSAASLGQMLDRSLCLLEQCVKEEHRPKLVMLAVAPVCLFLEDQTKVAKPEQPKNLLMQAKQCVKDILHLHTERTSVQKEVAGLVGDAYFELGLKEDEGARWNRSLSEYAAYYSCDFSKYRVEQLKQFVALCRQHKIKLLVVTSPLDRENLALMTRISYEQYVEKLKSCLDKNCGFIDLGRSQEFERADYFDPAHCNGTGGRKMVDLITPKMAQMLTDQPSR